MTTASTSSQLSVAGREELEQAYQHISRQSNTRSLLQECLTRDVFDKLKERSTSTGVTLLDVIKSGLENPSSKVGVYAPDAESYDVFSLLFYLIVERYHGVMFDRWRPPRHETSTAIAMFPSYMDRYIVSSRIRACRSMVRYPCHSFLDEDGYRNIERSFIDTSKSFPAELAGAYYPLKDIVQRAQDDSDVHTYAFTSLALDDCLRSVKAHNHHPIGRGVFLNHDRTFIVWVNEEDHLRIISLRKGSSLGETYKLLNTALRLLEKRLNFTTHPTLGHLTFCPTNVGSTIRASVHVRLPRLSRDIKRLERLADEHGLQTRGVGGERSKVGGEVFDISNRQRLGVTEVEAVRILRDGLIAVVEFEENM